jgi:hypothetical protein
MASKTDNTASNATVRRQPNRQAITFELVEAHAPNQGLADNLARTFGLDEVDYAAIRETTEEHVALSAQALQPTLSERAMPVHLQRIVGAFVSSAYGAAMFYGTKVSQARDLTARRANENRDEDNDGVFGFESRAQRARRFAAETGLQAYALMAAAEGAVSAYAHITGEEWKPYEPPPVAPASVARQSAATELAAFG